MTTDQAIALLVALGGGAFIREIVTGLWKWATGRQESERSTIQKAWADLDSETAYRRRVTEHAHELRRRLIDLGHGDDLAPFPSRTPPDPPKTK